MKPSKRTRFAIYARYSSELQNELSLEAQEEQCQRAIVERGGVVVQMFRDGAKSGWSLERDGFKQLCRAAEHGKFEAIMFWKFDRLARNHDHAVMIKMLLRHEYGLKLYCVEGFSEDENDSPYTALMEQMLAVFAAFYSKNLSNETKRGKRQRALNGEFNGSVAPLGYILVTLAEATIEMPAGLYIHIRLAAIVRRAFRKYATGNYTDQMIAEWMNSRKEIQELRAGKPPIGKEMVRDMLQNRVYTGRVPYAETSYSGSLGQGKKSNRKRRQWFEGKHEGFISDDLFDACQAVRRNLAKTRHPPKTTRTYILSGRVFCACCSQRKPISLADKNYGKMRPKWNTRVNRARYHCIARDRGYPPCDQRSIYTELVDAQVVDALSQLAIPGGLRERIEQAVWQNSDNDPALQRIASVRERVERIDFSWEKGFLTAEEYVAKRSQLQREIEALWPLDYDDLVEAADQLSYFQTYWSDCQATENPAEAQMNLLAKIVDRVFVHGKQVIAIVLHDSFSVVLDQDHYPSDAVTMKTQTRGKPIHSAPASDDLDGHSIPGKPECAIWVAQETSYVPLLRLLTN
jgi:site-specific DNA recombinase